MAGSMWVGNDRIGEVEAITVSLARDTETEVKRGVAGTLVLSMMDFALLDKHFPKHDDDISKADEVVVKIDQLTAGYPTAVHLLGFIPWSEGWGWTTDDLCQEYAITWTADDFDYSFVKED